MWQDIPHIIKRIVNALELSNPSSRSRRKLSKFDGAAVRPLCLAMIRGAWESLGCLELGQIRESKLTLQHVEKNAFSRMNVRLAVQVVSQSVVRLLQHAAGSNILPQRERVL